MKKLINTAFLILSIGAIISFVPVFIYFWKFGSQNLAPDSNLWSNFGSFIGGTLNPIVGFTNLALLLVISFYVAKLDNYRHFNEYRFLSYLNICSQFEQTMNTSISFNQLRLYLETFKTNNQFLFLNKNNIIFNNLIDKLIISADERTLALEKFEDELRTGKASLSGHFSRSFEKNTDQAFIGLAKNDDAEFVTKCVYNECKKNIIGFFQAVMIDGDMKIYREKSNCA